MKNQVEVSFNQTAYEIDAQALKDNLNKLIKSLDYIELITSKRELLTLEQVEQVIISKTGFKNILMSATLLGVETEYAYLQRNLDAIRLDVIEFKDNIPTLKDSALEELKSIHTTYLKDELVKDYNILNEACTILNKLSNPSFTDCLNRNYLGQWSVNILKLNNSNF
ncbi:MULTISPECIES: hypothetical protein [Flavobacterium]|uniref:Uncharacterized protein n=1 Tax=Flavobacterium keumense TaxID=1306518 RepID=A0ABY8N3L9_9FLAO|nr:MULTISPECIES: hypothetical protein [Flavobacterium]WGK94253.1 hypothetical protein MG292_09220 [Flavobacterium keumense]